MGKKDLCLEHGEETLWKVGMLKQVTEKETCCNIDGKLSGRKKTSTKEIVDLTGL